jgi:hypothetical protein
MEDFIHFIQAGPFCLALLEGPPAIPNSLFFFFAGFEPLLGSTFSSSSSTSSTTFLGLGLAAALVAPASLLCSAASAAFSLLASTCSGVSLFLRRDLTCHLIWEVK